MLNVHPLTSEEASFLVVQEIASAALADAKRQSLELPPDDDDARHLLVRRIVLAINAGVTDIPELRELALHPMLTRVRNAGWKDETS
jgi:hypothetical protein